VAAGIPAMANKAAQAQVEPRLSQARINTPSGGASRSVTPEYSYSQTVRTETESFFLTSGLVPTKIEPRA